MTVKVTPANNLNGGLALVNDKTFARLIGTEILHAFKPGESDPKDIQNGKAPSERLVKIAHGLRDIVVDKKILTNLNEQTITKLTDALRRYLQISSNNRDKLERALRYIARNPILLSS